MFLDRFVTTDELWATGATFTVVAWAFAYTFMAVQVIWPGSFTAAIAPDAPRTWFQMLFLSFTNLTSVGLSDITPVMPHARSWVMIEQVAGLMYVALVVSRIVARASRRPRARARSPRAGRSSSTRRGPRPDRRGHHARGSVDRDAADVVSDELDLTRVDTDPDRQADAARASGSSPPRSGRPSSRRRRRPESRRRSSYLAPAEDVEVIAQTCVVGRSSSCHAVVAESLEWSPWSRRYR